MSQKYQLDYQMYKPDSKTLDIRIYGVILESGWDYEDKVSGSNFARKLDEAGDVDEINVYINSRGGLAHEGIAILSDFMLKPCKKKTIYIMSLCASAATMPACLKGEGVEVIALEGSQYMIHEPECVCYGRADDMRKSADDLDKLKENVIDIYQARCGKDRETIAKWMKEEYTMTPQEMVENGFADRILSKNQTNTMSRMNAVMLAEEKPLMEEGELISNGAAAPTEHKEMKKENDEMDFEKLTMEQLEAQKPDLCKQLMEKGAKAERARMQKLEEMCPAKKTDMLKDAKYGENPKTAEAFAMELMAEMRKEEEAAEKAKKEGAQAFMTKRAKETAAMEGVEPEGGSDEGGEGKEREAFAQMAAKMYGKK